MGADIEARGTFEIDLEPQESTVQGMAVMALSKVFSGDLVGSSEGAMLSAGDPTTGSAGYVAIEVVTGSIGARTGTFALQQFGVMDGQGRDLTYVVTPGSGRCDFTGIAGTVDLTVDEDGTHHYRLVATVPA